MRIVCQQTILMNIMPYLLFFKKRQNFYLSSAANYRWRFKGYAMIIVRILDCIPIAISLEFINTEITPNLKWNIGLNAGFLESETQTSLLSYWDWLEIWKFARSKFR